MEKISTGSFDLNEWLEGGYEKGVVTMIVGPAGSGKSNFSVLAACSQAREKKVIFIGDGNPNSSLASNLNFVFLSVLIF